MTQDGQLILVTGGARSGKSRLAAEMADAMSRDVVFIATAEPADEEMRARIREHQRRRPRHWRTIEQWRDLADVIGQNDAPGRVIVLDCLTLLISNLLGCTPSNGGAGAAEEVLSEVQAITEAAAAASATVIVVANEVGLGLVPVRKLGRLFRDLAGEANQMLAAQADVVYVMLAGIPLKIKGD